MEERCIICNELFIGCCEEQKLPNGEKLHSNCYKLMTSFDSIEMAQKYYKMLAASVRVSLHQKGIHYRK